VPTVGFIRHNFLPSSETFIYTTIKSLEKWDVDVFALRRMSEQKFPYERVTIPGALDRLLYRATTGSPRFFRWARGVKLLHAHMGWTGAHGLWAARRLGLPLVTSFYGYDVTLKRSTDPAYWHYLALRGRLFRRGDRFLVLSEQMKQALVARGCPEAKIRVVPLGVDISRFTMKTHAPGKLTVLMVGREVEKKGFDDGLAACAAARDAGVDLKVVVLGTGDTLLPSLKKQASDLKLDATWPDPSTRVPDAMREADVLLVPSRTASNGDQEGTPTVICEGSAAGLPIVSTRHAGIPSQVDEGVTGYLSDERDVAGLAASLMKLADPAVRNELGRAGRARAERTFSLAALRRNLEAVYDELLQ
jgi:glycosyltransferase involved in cell wall biosynthesis